MKAYQTVYELIRNEIEAGKYSIGDLLPPEPELQKTYQYSRTTIRKAISLLVNDGFISVQQGKGTQVISGIPRNEYYKFHNSPDITEIFASNDSSIVMEKLSIDSVEANQEISNALSLPISSRVYRVQRLLSNAGIPFSYIINYIRQDVAPELPKFSNISFLNLYQLLEQEYGILFKNGTEHITAIKSDFIESQVLDINIGSPILMMTRYAQTEDDTPLEYAKTYIRPDRYSIAVHLHGWPAIGKKPMSTSLSSHFC